MGLGVIEYIESGNDEFIPLAEKSSFDLNLNTRGLSLLQLVPPVEMNVSMMQ